MKNIFKFIALLFVTTAIQAEVITTTFTAQHQTNLVVTGPVVIEAITLNNIDIAPATVILRDTTNTATMLNSNSAYSVLTKTVNTALASNVYTNFFGRTNVQYFPAGTLVTVTSNFVAAATFAARSLGTYTVPAGSSLTITFVNPVDVVQGIVATSSKTGSIAFDVTILK